MVLSMVVAYAVVILVVGVVKGRREEGMEDYIAGAWRIP